MPQQHTPTDSLIYLNNNVAGLLGDAVEEIHGTYALENALETEELPEHIQLAVSMIDHAIELIRSEARLQSASSRTHYSNGVPVVGIRTESRAEPLGDGTHQIVQSDVHIDIYPDGEPWHPLSRQPGDKAS